MFFPPSPTTGEELLAKMPSQAFRSIASKVIRQERLSAEEGLFLLTHELKEPTRLMADFARRQKVGDTVYYATTLFIHPTNLCELSCPMCSFYAKPGMEKAWFLSPEAIEAKVKEHLHQNLTEVHFVGGLWRDCDLSYYQEVFSRVKALDQNLHIKALTPVEYDFLAKMHGISITEVFEKMMDWGLGSLPGGGAEVLVERVRKALAPQKITSDEYLEVHKIAHRAGLSSNITLLFGSIEEPEDIVTHLVRVREVQDETGGFNTFVPLKYHEENNALGKRKNRLKPKEVGSIYALSRLMLDNIRNLKVLWNYVGVSEAQEMLHYGANDFASTALDEKIITMAGGVQVKMTGETIERLITESDRQPKKIHSGYAYAKEELAVV